ncbi:HWE histidine kinase domain-containing protein [Novosphingobium beihaiensis]|uniref:histidine kinase n=1 Tax=Novosphingobium beihaiensis TaxID=2930389 RepID=A0ABT0BUX2_9SPHN|nr:HWE histidine kinase domain-containing protein [Novosphingobium beihaiensis]MCJ2188875.1 GAF domain-containing protein [Novosphingobium beihaiensis]
MNSPVTLTSCDREPIHHLGRIQGFGWLIAFTPDWTVARVSANIATLLELTADELLGLHISELFSSETIHTLRSRLAVLYGDDAVERIFGLGLFPERPEALYDLALHVSHRNFVVEIEPSRSELNFEPLGIVRNMMARLEQCDSIESYLSQSARMLRAVIGFDRVMVYRFDERANGMVVAESLNPGIDSFLGLNYPASDIPQQARKLYVRTPFRIIADVADPGVPIVPEHNYDGEPADLSLSVLRSVSPIHIEYLCNMGVAASLSVSIIVDGSLWGLFACHHYAPILPSFGSRTLAELFGQLCSLKLEARLHNARMDQEHAARQAGDRLLAGIAHDRTRLEDPEFISDCLQNVVPCDGVATIIDNRIATIGTCPDDPLIRAMAQRLNAADGGRVLVFDRLADLLPAAAEQAHAAAGMMAIPISRAPRDYVMLFRKEQLQTVDWAGKPEKAVSSGPNGDRLTPRGSFALWQEEVRGKSAPFTHAERYIGEALRNVLTEVVLRLADRARDDMHRANERQELLIAELNHRVRNILTLVRGIINQSSNSAGDMESFVSILDGRVRALARAHDQITRDKWGPAAIRQLIAAEAEAYCNQAEGRVRVSGPVTLLEPEAFTTLALVVHELVTNSVKYGALSDSGTITVTIGQDDQDQLLLDWQESGGPPVRAPTRRGFGTTIINHAIPHDLGGEARVDYALNGLKAHFVIPARFVHKGANYAQPEARRPVPSGEAHANRQPLKGMRVLLVEDSLIIAVDVEASLQELGAQHVDMCSSGKAALSAIDANQPDCAILDYNLGNENSLPVADALISLGVPVLFATGYGEENDLGTGYATIPILQKPYDQAELSQALIAALSLPR